MKLTIFTFLCLGLLAGCWPRSRSPCVYELPEGFIGWAMIEFDVDGAAPIPRRDGKLVFKFPPSGRLITSSRVEEGFAKDEFYYVGKTRTLLPVSIGGSDGLVWGQVTGVTGRRTFQRFFVGSREDMAAQREQAPSPK